MAFPKHLRLWGIGGVGMSALAEHLHQRGYLITGYDREPSPQTERLQQLGIPIDFSPRPEAIHTAEGVIYTPAIPADFPEWAEARRQGLPVWRRAQALAECVAPYKVLAVAGAHGKTSTSAILTWLLHALGASPVAFVGGIMRNFGSTYLDGEGPWAVVEADEYDKALLLLRPEHAILLSVDPDHLEIYGSPQAVVETYKIFLSQVRGLCVGPAHLPELGRPLLRYQVEEYGVREGRVYFGYTWAGGRREAEWSQIGRHFAENAAAALVLLEAMGYPYPEIREALRGFRGVYRRMELYAVQNRYFLVSDYAHHPTEIQRTLEALRESFPGFRLVAVFQPHLYSRTAFFAEEFGKALSLADEVVLFPIYAAREPSTPHVTHKLISPHVRVPVREYLPLQDDMDYFLVYFAEAPVVMAFLGAGDIYRWVEPVYSTLRKSCT